MLQEQPPRERADLETQTERETNSLLASQAADVIRLGAAAAAGVREVGRNRLPLWTGLALVSHWLQGQPILKGAWEHGWGAIGGIASGAECLSYTLPRGINPITEISKYSAKFYCDSWPYDTWYQAIISHLSEPVWQGIGMVKPVVDLVTLHPGNIAYDFFGHTLPGAFALAGAAVTIRALRGCMGVGRAVNQVMQNNHAET